MKKDYRKYSETSNEEVQLTIDDVQEVTEIEELDVESMTDEQITERIAFLKDLLTNDMEDDARQPILDELKALGYEEEVVENEVTDKEIQNDSEEHTGNVDEIVNGELSGCAKLNVRREASKDSDVVCVLDKDASFTVNVTASTEDFYKVYACVNEVLYEGFCVKQFISIK